MMYVSSVFRVLQRGHGIMVRQMAFVPRSTISLARTFCQQDGGDFVNALRSVGGGSVELAKDETTGMAHVLLKQPTVKNAMSGKMMAELTDIVNELEQWESGKGILLQGADGTFSSGGDLNSMKAMLSPGEGVKFSAFMQQTTTRLFNLPMISLAVVEGPALGAGADLAMACDFRVMAKSATFGFAHGAIGLVPGWGGGARLTNCVGRTRALDMISTSKVFTSDEALEIGLVQALVPEGQDVTEFARQWLGARVAGDVRVVRAMKKVIVNASPSLTNGVLDTEREMFGTVWAGPAHTMALQNAKKIKIKHKAE